MNDEEKITETSKRFISVIFFHVNLSSALLKFVLPDESLFKVR